MYPPCTEIIASATKILMHSSLCGRYKKKLKLINQSNFVGKFMFDLTDKKQYDNNIFQLDIICGNIKAKSNINITIIFSPIEKKIYYFPLICLILNGNPIIIEIYGYCEINFIEKYIALEPQLNTKLNTFEKYFDDNTRRIRKNNQTHILSLSQNYLVFEKNSTLNPCQTNSVTNHTSYELILEWEKDINGIFIINPQSLRISSGDSGHFEITFIPLLFKRGKWYNKDLVAYCIIKSPKIQYTFALIRLMGYWLPNKIECINKSIDNNKRMKKFVNDGESIIILPPCTPGTSSYTTFLIRNDSEHPLAFQFISPHSDFSTPTQFNIKPLMGILYEKYQIVAVEMFPDTIDEYLYSERWSIEFNKNLNSQSHVNIEFRGIAQIPKICIGNDNNKINFPSVHPGCQSIQSVFIKNLTHHKIHYVFSDLPSYIILNKLSGDICDHEIYFVDWIFRPTQSGLYECNILCSIIALGEYASTEKPIEMRVHISAMSAIGLLKADPDELNFMEIPYNELKIFNFHVLNPSNVEMYFKLMSKPVTGEIDCEEFSKFQMHPIFGHLLPNERQQITISLIPCKIGFFKFFILYSVNELHKPISICTINYTCILPIIKIIDMQYHLINPNFGKLTLWRIFKVNLLNKIFNEIEPNEEKSVDIYLPQIAMTNDSSILKFLIKNVSSIPAYWCVKKNLIFSSTNKNKNIKSNIIHPDNGILQSCATVIVTIELSQVIYCDQCQYYILFGENRRVKLSFNHLSQLLYGPNIILDNVYLGDIYPRYQAFWLYNSTPSDLSYSIDIEAFNVINAHHRSKALTCMNFNGSIPTQMLHPILVKFQPRRLADFRILIPIIVGEAQISLIMKGGTSLIHQRLRIPRELPQLSQNFYIPEVPVYINTDIIILSNIPLSKRMIYTITLFNRSNSEVFGYEWRYYKIIDVIYLSVLPQKGRIQPLETHSFQLIVETGNEPFRIDANIACQLINYTSKRIYWRFIDLHNKKMSEMKEQFTITKNGIFYGMLECPKNLPRAPIPFYRVLTVCCMTSDNVRNDGNILSSKARRAVVNDLPIEILNIASETLAAIIW